MVLGVITARGGSKGIPGKNMVDIDGRPLLDYALATASACRRLDRIVLSSDMPEAIRWTKRNYPRVEVPFVRPARLSGPRVTQDRVVLHAIDFLEAGHACAKIDVVVLLEPTCPFRVSSEIDTAIRLFRKKRLQSLFGVSRAWHHPSDYVYVDPKNPRRMKWVFRRHEWRQRQDFPPVWFITGALYICRVNFLRETGRFYDETGTAFPMADETMIDIDAPFDLELARGFAARQRLSGKTQISRAVRR